MNITFTYEPTEEEIKKVMKTYKLPREKIHVVSRMNGAVKRIMEELKD